MLANSAAKAPAIPKVIPTNLTPKAVKPNGANASKALQKRPKRPTLITIRYSFEITPELKDQLQQTITDYRKATGKNISNSSVIRTALAKYLKGGKL
jgi:hypothetical protein